MNPMTDEQLLTLAKHVRAVHHQEKPDTELRCEQRGCRTMVSVYVIVPHGGSISARCPEHGWDVTVRMDERNPLGIGVLPKEVPAS